VDLASLPVQVESSFPLRLTVEAPDDDTLVSTPRGFISGYEATVNGHPARPAKSAAGQVMVAVPKGRSQVALRYVGAPELYRAFWISAGAWLLLLVFALGHLAGIDWARFFAPVDRGVRGVLTPLLTYKWIAVTLVLLAGAFGWKKRQDYLDAVGPIRLTFQLPSRETGRTQPLLVTGRQGAGTIFFVRYVNDSSIKIGVDIWNSALLESPPFRVDYSELHTVVINASGLYPLDHPRVRALDPAARDDLRSTLRVEFDGHLVVDSQRTAYDSTPEEITVGTMKIGGSTAEDHFDGKISQVERLPFAAIPPSPSAPDAKSRTAKP
jgi:hypothetical protein